MKASGQFHFGHFMLEKRIPDTALVRILCGPQMQPGRGGKGSNSVPARK